MQLGKSGRPIGHDPRDAGHAGGVRGELASAVWPERFVDELGWEAEVRERGLGLSRPLRMVDLDIGPGEWRPARSWVQVIGRRRNCRRSIEGGDSHVCIVVTAEGLMQSGGFCTGHDLHIEGVGGARPGERR